MHFINANRVNLMHLNLCQCYLNHTIHIIVLQHLYFNNKTSSAHSSSINASESVSDSSSLRIKLKMLFEWTFVLIHFLEGIANFFSLLSSNFMARLSSQCTVTFMLRSLYCNKFSKLGAHCFRNFCANVMYVNLAFGKLVFILFNINFLRVLNMHH